MKRLLAFVLALCLVTGGMVFPAGQNVAYAEAVATPQVACGGYHSMVLKADGTVWTWGRNNYGQLGDGTTYDRLTPVQVPSLSGVVAISCGNDHNLALKADGTVWGWGRNIWGQIGDGTTTDRDTPVQVQNLTGVTAIYCGLHHSLALKTNGMVWAWGSNGFGQLGDGTTTARHTPNQVSSLSGVVAISCGSAYSLALKTDSTVRAWGYNYYGQIGDGTTTHRYTPVQVSNLTGVASISCGQSQSLALKADGTVWAWGHNNYGQIGDSTTTDKLTPVQTSGLNDITAISGGQFHSIALKNNGTVWAWGHNNYGQIGDSTTTDKLTPVQTSGLNNITTISSGAYHNIALNSDGTVWAWGRNNYGQIGDGTTTDQYIPIQVPGLNLFATPAAPSNLTASPGDAQVALSWDTVTDAVYYDVKRSETTGGPYTIIFNDITGTSCTDTGVTNGNTYYYVVSASNAYGEGPDSTEVSATPQEAVPGAPSNLTATAGNAQVALSWNAAEGASGYNVKRAETAGGPYYTIASDVAATSYTDTGLTNGTTYYYVVSANSASGESANSNEASATPQGMGGNRAILELTMTNGVVKEYDLSASEVAAFLNWYAARSGGAGPAYIALSKAFLNGPFVDRKEYVPFDSILSFEVMEY